MAFTLTSKDFTDGGTIANAQVFNGWCFHGGNVSPTLSWSGAPAGTKSFALMVHDPDAPTGSGWWHWIVYNIPANTTSLAAGAGDPQKKLLPEIFANSQKLQTYFQLRQDLAAIWDRSTASREQLLAQLQDWCHRAEQSGIKALQEFATRLRRYA